MRNHVVWWVWSARKENGIYWFRDNYESCAELELQLLRRWNDKGILERWLTRREEILCDDRNYYKNFSIESKRMVSTRLQLGRREKKQENKKISIRRRNGILHSHLDLSTGRGKKNGSKNGIKIDANFNSATNQFPRFSILRDQRRGEERI